jgi:hypothetical protein
MHVDNYTVFFTEGLNVAQLGTCRSLKKILGKDQETTKRCVGETSSPRRFFFERLSLTMAELPIPKIPNICFIYMYLLKK